MATADEKFQPDGVTPAEGTYENNVVRAVTSLLQSTQSYGIPMFYQDTAGNPQHGDCRNEYGLFALNQFLAVGDLAYVIRANVNLDDNRDDVMALWERTVVDTNSPARVLLEQLIATRINLFNNGMNPTGAPLLSTNPPTQVDSSGNPVLYKITVTVSELLSDMHTAMTQAVYSMYSFRNEYNAVGVITRNFQTLFEDDHSTVTCAAAGNAPGFCIFNGTNGFSSPPTSGYIGFTALANQFSTLGQGTVIPTQFSIAEASSLLSEAAGEFEYTLEFANMTILGADDAARRVEIVKQLTAVINSNNDVRSEQYEYNLILCPGFHEVVDEMIALANWTGITGEAFVVGETPMNLDPDTLANQWAVTGITGNTTDRQHSNLVAYYYPHGLTTNLDGSIIMCAASGIALSVYAYSDNVSQLWFAPAGTQRGLVSGVTDVGYVSGTLGTSSVVWNSVALTPGQRDNLYQYTTNINPIANLPGLGILVFGQKTSQSTASALDRVNVSRLVAYIRRQIRKNLIAFLFEPNDQITQNNVKAVVTAFLQSIMVKRGLYDFAVQCDANNNTPDRIDANELYVDIALKPMKAVEFIYVPIRIVTTGTNIH